MKAECVEDLEVYRLAFSIQQRLFEISKSFPREETYALTDQMRRAARAVGANLAEAWAKRRYPAHFRSKLTDADGEKCETMHWVRTALNCRYVDEATAESIATEYAAVGRKLGSMIRDAESWAPRASTAHRSPSTDNRPLPTAHCPPATAHRQPSTG